LKIDTTSGEFDYTYLSLGAGVQSSALLVLSCTDDRVPKCDHALFSDTGDEPQYVYDYLEVLTEYASRHGIEVLTAQQGVLSADVLERKKVGKAFVSVPLYTIAMDGKKGLLRRQCTREYKIDPMSKKVRELLGYKPRQRMRHRVRSMLGITIDETRRMKPSWYPWITNTWPLVDLGLHRDDCFKIIADAGLPEPQKSACVYCPYHSDAYWQWMKDEQPVEFKKAVDFDEAVRDMTMRGKEEPGYVHKSCVPLKEAVFNASDPNQVDLWTNECEGMCGV
jgi:hypothetical protein